jgi:DNA-binding beta-propeller fold protein YncE
MKRNLRLIALLASIVMLGVSACAPVSKKTAEQKKEDHVYPGPPDEPRFAFERVIMNSMHVTGVSESSALKYALTGVVDAGGEGMGKPYAIAVHRGRIFVSDTVERMIKVFDVPEKRFFVIKDVPNGEMGKPLGVDVDGKGNLYVADASNRTIHVFDREGKYLRKIGDEKQFDRLSSVTVDKDGTRVYAVDIGGVQSENHRVRMFDAKTGEHLADIGKRGVESGEFNLPRDLAIGKDGRLYVVDGGNFRVQIFDKDGKFMKSFGKVGKQMGDFARPKEVATDPEGNVYVADAAFGNFQIFNPEGELLMFAGSRSDINGPARYMLPAGIYVDEDGRLYMGDQWFRKVDIFRPVGVKAGEGALYTGLGNAAPPTPAKK